MAAVIDMASMAALLKERFYEVTYSVFKDQPGLTLLNTNEDFGGTDGKYPLETNTSQGIGGSFGAAFTNQTAPQVVAWQMVTKPLYALSTLDGVTYRRAMGDKNSFVDIVANTTKMDARGHRLEMGVMVYGDGTGTIGQISSISTGVITLVNPTDTLRFSKGMTLQQCATLGGPTALAAVGYVIAVNYRQGVGTVTVSATPGGAAGNPTGWAGTTGYLNRYGNLNQMASGYAAWIPVTPPGATDIFYGVPRGSDSKLYGTYFNGQQGRDIASALITGNGEISNMGGSPNLVLATNRSWNALKDTFQGTVPYETVTTEAGISFNSIQLHGDTGKMNVVADRNCTAKTAWMLQMDTWELISVGKPTGLLEYPGMGAAGYFQVRPDADAVQCRVGGDWNIVCKNPAGNGQIALAL